MKLPISLFLLPAAATAFSCGGRLTKPCLGEKDICYDKKARNAFTDQAPVYRILQGYYSCSQYFYDATTGLPLEDGTSFGAPGGKVFPHYLFLNSTYLGSRSYTHRINVYKNVNQGDPGFAGPQDAWGTTTYEKDGSVKPFGANSAFTDSFQPVEDAISYPVDNGAVYASGHAELGGFPVFFSEVSVCLDDECRQLSGNQDVFADIGGTSVSLTQAVRNCNKIDSAEEWMQAVQDAYVAYNVPEASWVPLPTVGG
jgi:hypothetical protein